VGIGEGLGAGVGVSIGVGEGVGITCCDTFQVHVRDTMPFSLDATTDTFHVPATALAFVYSDSVTRVRLKTSVSLSSQLTFTDWSVVMLKVLDSPSTS